jgi:uncharacterized protein involved in type VI secretion and phage assembly
MRAGGPRTPTGDMTLCGVYYAVVTQNQDPENKCRVKVRLPWLDQGDTDQTQWAQVAVPMAGSGFGWYTIPDIDDVVAVMFLAGDIARPVVLGGVWSKEDPPPEKNDGEQNDFRGYKSRSGHRLVLDDSSNGKVYLADKTDNNAVVVGSFQQGGSGDNARAGSTAPAVGAPGQSGVSIASMDGELAITAKGNLTVEAMNVEITAQGDVDLKASGDLTLEGLSTMCNGGSTKLEGSDAKIN